MPAKILNLHRRKTKNVGDLLCAPHLYFPELLGADAREILGFRVADEPDRGARLAFKDAFAEADMIFVGGGGLLEIDFFQPFFKFLADNKRSNQKVVLWGAGHNSWKLGDWRHLKQSYSFESGLFDLIGVRDSDHHYPWVPCVSCMDTTFDAPAEITREVGVYAHSGTLRNETLKKKLPTGLDILDNSSNFSEALEFIGSCELVLTDSFHGAYWATLLGRRVIAFPSSSKFYDLRHPVPICAPEDWSRFRALARAYPEALPECRAANVAFSERLQEMLSSTTTVL